MLKTHLMTLSVSVSILLSSCHSYKYEGGRDTIHMFGDGKFQIGRIYNGSSGEYAMFDATSSISLALNVKIWHESKEFAYVIGEDGWKKLGAKYHMEFFLIDLSSNKLSRYKKLSQVPTPHRAVFDSLQS